jgi:hypothetical protein
MPGKDFDALVVGAHYEDDTILMRFGPEDDPEETGGYEEWSYRLEGDGFRIELFESIRIEDKEVIWELDSVEGADKAEVWLRFPLEAKGIGYK